jgi:hypothetical protein
MVNQPFPRRILYNDNDANRHDNKNHHRYLVQSLLTPIGAVHRERQHKTYIHNHPNYDFSIQT